MAGEVTQAVGNVFGEVAEGFAGRRVRVVALVVGELGGAPGLGCRLALTVRLTCPR